MMKRVQIDRILTCLLTLLIMIAYLGICAKLSNHLYAWNASYANLFSIISMFSLLIVIPIVFLASRKLLMYLNNRKKNL